jgi:hypothetical protein
MKTWKIVPGICLAMTLVWGLAPAAFGALVTSDAQVVNLGATPPSGDTSGILSFTNLFKINPNGTQTAFTLPANKCLVVTYININVQGATSLTTNADLRMGPFYSRVMAMTNGFTGYTETFDPGILINPSGFTNPDYGKFYAVDLQNGQTITGKVNVRIIGYLVSYP